MILVMAFGEHTLHMDLVRKAKAWRWKGGICGRNREPPPKLSNARAYAPPWNDECLRRFYEGTHGPHFTPEFPKEHNVGIMGFLVSCKQAYTEGIDVLYSANTIIILGEPLLLHLPQLIPHNRLASITSLELAIQAHRIDHSDEGKPSYNLDHLEPILNNIATHCHRLRSFWLSFKVGSRDEEILNTPALSFLDAFSRSMQLRRMRVDLPLASYSKAPDRDISTYEDGYKHPREKPTDDVWKRSLWRSLDSEHPVGQNRTLERYPYPPLRMPVVDGDETVESKGYWLLWGDEGPHSGHVRCF